MRTPVRRRRQGSAGRGMKNGGVEGAGMPMEWAIPGTGSAAHIPLCSPTGAWTLHEHVPVTWYRRSAAGGDPHNVMKATAIRSPGAARSTWTCQSPVRFEVGIAWQSLGELEARRVWGGPVVEHHL